MIAQFLLLILFAVLLMLSLLNVIPMEWTAICIAYLAAAKAAEVLMSSRIVVGAS